MRLPLNILYAITIKHIIYDCHLKYGMRLSLKHYMRLLLRI